MTDKPKQKPTYSLGSIQLFTAVLALAKLLESPYMVDVPWWSWNIFTFSVGILYVWCFWFLVVAFITFFILNLFKFYKDRRSWK